MIQFNHQPWMEAATQTLNSSKQPTLTWISQLISIPNQSQEQTLLLFKPSKTKLEKSSLTSKAWPSQILRCKMTRVLS